MAFADVFRTPATDDELYRMIVNVLIAFRQVESVNDPAGFRDCLHGLEEYLDIRRIEDGRKLDRGQRMYVQSVRERCLAQPDKLRHTIDRLTLALDEPDIQAARQLYGELDGVFRPRIGGDGWEVVVRAASG